MGRAVRMQLCEGASPFVCVDRDAHDLLVCLVSALHGMQIASQYPASLRSPTCEHGGPRAAQTDAPLPLAGRCLPRHCGRVWRRCLAG